MAVRGGYSIAYDRLMNLPTENYRHSPPLRAQVCLARCSARGSPTASATRASLTSAIPSIPPCRPASTRNGVIGRPCEPHDRRPGLGRPTAHNWFVGVQRELWWGIAADANYIGSAGRNLDNAYNVNRSLAT